MTLNYIALKLRRLAKPDVIAAHRRAYLDGGILIVVCLASVASILVHGSHSAAEQGKQQWTSPLAPIVSASVSASPLPLLSPPVQTLTDITVATPLSSPADAATPTPAALAQPVLPDPSALLTKVTSAAPTAAAPSSAGRPSRAEALPALPMAAGAGAGGQGQTVTTLDSQYADHTITSGETLSSIANSYGVTVDTLLANNAGIDDLDLIHPGQTLRIPTMNGLLYHVQAGDTLDDISRRYGVSLADVINLPANGLQNTDVIHPGDTILLPGNIRPPAPAPVIAKALPAPAQAPAPVPASSPPEVIAQAAPAPAPASAPAPALLQNADSVAATATAAPPAPVSTPPVPIARFIWPIQGPITQAFGVPELGVGAPHTGVDIGLYGRDGAPIAASAAGTVEFSGGDACCSYGYYVMIKHPNGFETLYGHLSKRAVDVGQTVTQGQTIGYAGDTGFSTGTHLHFEIRLNGVFQNPLTYLP